MREHAVVGDVHMHMKGEDDKSACMCAAAAVAAAGGAAVVAAAQHGWVRACVSVCVWEMFTCT